MDNLPKLGHMIAELLTTLRQAEHLFSLMRHSQSLRDLIPEPIKSRYLHSCLYTNHLIQQYQSQCILWLKKSSTADQKEAITVLQNALNEIQIIQASLLFTLTSKTPESLADNVTSTNLKQVLHDIQNPFH